MTAIETEQLLETGDVGEVRARYASQIKGKWKPVYRVKANELRSRLAAKLQDKLMGYILDAVQYIAGA